MVSGVLAGAVAAVVLAAGGAMGPVAVAAGAGGTPSGGEGAVSGPRPQPRPVPHRDVAGHGPLGHSGFGYWAPARGAAGPLGSPARGGAVGAAPLTTALGAGTADDVFGTGFGAGFGDITNTVGTVDRRDTVDPADAVVPAGGTGIGADPLDTPGLGLGTGLAAGQEEGVDPVPVPGTGTGTGTDGFQTVVSEQAAAGGGTRPHGSYSLRLQSRFSAPSARLTTPTPPSSVTPRALTYDTSLVPVGASVVVEQRTDDDGTRVTLRAEGLAAGHAFGAHVHTGACTEDPASAGGHYQHQQDPVQPSTDPAYANDRNEVWLDFTTDALGTGSAAADHTWDFRPGEARSVVLHRGPGGSGERVACFTVPFRGW